MNLNDDAILVNAGKVCEIYMLSWPDHIGIAFVSAGRTKVSPKQGWLTASFRVRCSFCIRT